MTTSAHEPNTQAPDGKRDTAIFECPYCKRETATPRDGWLEDENDPESEVTQWRCATCQADWWAYGHDTPEHEKVLFFSPRYPDDEAQP